MVAHQASGDRMVKQIKSKYAFEEALNSAGDKLVVADFSAAWCGFGKMIKLFFNFLSEDVAAECEVKCIPTFQFLTTKGQKGDFSGANKEK
ncbi:thioredoxin-like [Myotis myotis]|uniref:thioredoxin-like n=1 Tax=Myotis myotis TaxID=51298 RepID=UPI0017484558|nr:thioredoxin-like [Myotis myotis]